MQLQVKGRNLDVGETIRSHAEQKFAKLGRQLDESTRVELELAVERNPSIAASHVAEATIFTKGPNLRARAAASDMRAAIDALCEKLHRQVKEYREKRSGRSRTAAERG